MKRATYRMIDENGDVVISIHALMKRATPYLCDNCMLVMYFNPRPHEEGD